MNPSTTTTTTSANKGGTSPVYRIPPHHYIHVLDQNTNVTRLEIGPKTFIKQDNETVTVGPEKMITVPYVIFCEKENKYSELSLDHVIIVLLNHLLYEMRQEKLNLIIMVKLNLFMLIWIFVLHDLIKHHFHSIPEKFFVRYHLDISFFAEYNLFFSSQ